MASESHGVGVRGAFMPWWLQLVVGQASKAYLTAANATFKAQPQALRDAQPVWIKRAYYSTELLIEPVAAVDRLTTANLRKH